MSPDATDVIVLVLACVREIEDDLCPNSSTFATLADLDTGGGGGSDPAWYHYDQVMRPVAMTEDPSGTETPILWRGHFEPFGETVGTSDGFNMQLVGGPDYEWEPSHRFLGQYEDLELQDLDPQAQNWNRMYLPALGRYQRTDAVGLIPPGLTAFTRSSNNLYGYAANNTYVYVDPDGRQMCVGGAALCASSIFDDGAPDAFICTGTVLACVVELTDLIDSICGPGGCPDIDWPEECRNGPSVDCDPNDIPPNPPNYHPPDGSGHYPGHPGSCPLLEGNDYDPGRNFLP